MKSILVLLCVISSSLYGQTSDVRQDSVSQKTEILKKILKADSIEITLWAEGCMSLGLPLKILITQTKNHYKLRCTKPLDGQVVERKLKKDKLKKIENIFIMGFEINGSGCTSTDRAEIKYKNYIARFKDNTCKYKLYSKLTETLNITDIKVNLD